MSLTTHQRFEKICREMTQELGPPSEPELVDARRLFDAGVAAGRAEVSIQVAQEVQVDTKDPAKYQKSPEMILTEKASKVCHCPFGVSGHVHMEDVPSLNAAAPTQTAEQADECAYCGCSTPNCGLKTPAAEQAFDRANDIVEAWRAKVIGVPHVDDSHLVGAIADAISQARPAFCPHSPVGMEPPADPKKCADCAEGEKK
jgi:hypothetical protein